MLDWGHHWAARAIAVPYQGWTGTLWWIFSSILEDIYSFQCSRLAPTRDMPSSKTSGVTGCLCPRLPYKSWIHSTVPIYYGSFPGPEDWSPSHPVPYRGPVDTLLSTNCPLLGRVTCKTPGIFYLRPMRHKHPASRSHFLQVNRKLVPAPRSGDICARIHASSVSSHADFVFAAARHLHRICSSFCAELM